jgi:hypothetical protein
MAANDTPAPPCPCDIQQVLEQAETALASWKAHIQAYATSADPELAQMMNAVRLAKIVQATVNQALCDTRALEHHSADQMEISVA